MKTSILICATCFIVTGCSAQLRFPSLSSALSSLTGFGSSASNAGSSSSSNSQSGQSSSPYSGGFVSNYGRLLQAMSNLYPIQAMSNLYPNLLKPLQQQQQQQQQQQVQPASQSPYDQAFSASQYASPSLFPSQSAPSFSFGGSTFSISPSLPFGSLTGSGSQSSQVPQSMNNIPSHSPFSASFGSSINSPSSFGPLSSSPFLQQAMPSFAPASSYNAAFEAANGGPSMVGSSFGNMQSSPVSGIHSSGPSLSNQALLSQSSNSNPINSYSSIPNFNSQHDGSSASLSQQHQSQQQSASLVQQNAHQSPFSNQQHNQPGQYQQYRPDMMSIAASAPMPSSNSYSNYGNIQSASSQQGPASPSSYQQPSYR